MRHDASEPRCRDAHSATTIGRVRAGYPGGSATRMVAPPPPNRTVACSAGTCERFGTSTARRASRAIVTATSLVSAEVDVGSDDEDG